MTLLVQPRERLLVLQKLLQEVKGALLPEYADLRNRLDASLLDLDALASDLESVLGTRTSHATATTPSTPSISEDVPLTPASWNNSSAAYSPNVAPAIDSVVPLPSPTNTIKIEDEPVGSDGAAAKALEAKKQATAAFKAHNYEAARALCSRAVELEPEEATHFSNRSLAHLRLGSFNEAQTDAAAAVALKPAWGRAHYRLGAAYQALENWSSAVRSFAAAVDLEPGSEASQRALHEAQRATKAAAYEAATGQTARQQAAADRARKLEADQVSQARARQLEVEAQAEARSRALAAQLEAARCAEDAARESKLAERRAAAEAEAAEEAALTDAVESHVAAVSEVAAQATRLLETSGMEGGDADAVAMTKVPAGSSDRSNRKYSGSTQVDSCSSGASGNGSENSGTIVRGGTNKRTERSRASEVAETARREALAAKTAAVAAAAASTPTTSAATTSSLPLDAAVAKTVNPRPPPAPPGKVDKVPDEPTPASTPAWAIAAAHQGASSSSSFSSPPSPLLLATTPHGGRFWTAKRKVTRGEVLLVESPLACVAQGQYAQDLCHFCLGRLEHGDGPPRACGRCKFTRWCSESCRVADRAAHADECGALESVSSSESSSGAVSNDAGLRLCLRLLGTAARGGPLARQKLSDLEAHDEKKNGGEGRSAAVLQDGHGQSRSERGGGSSDGMTRASSSSSTTLDRMVAGLGALSNGRFSSGPRSTVPANEVRHVIGVVRTNGFVVSDLEGRRLGNGLWGLASFFNHACWPNACVSFTQAPRKGGGSSSGGSNSGGSIGGGLVLEARALRDILLGEPITIGYTELYRPMALRQSTLQASKGFLCNCPRCCAEAKLDAADARQAELANSTGTGGSGTAGASGNADTPTSDGDSAAADGSPDTVPVVEDESSTEATTLALWETAKLAAAPSLAEAGSSNSSNGGEAGLQRRHQSALLAVVAALRAADGKSSSGSSTSGSKDYHKSDSAGNSQSSSSSRSKKNADGPLIPTHWLRFELHCLATTLLLAQPKADLPPSLVRALLPNASSSSSHRQHDHKSSSPSVAMDCLLYHARAAVACAERGGAYHGPLTASPGNARLAAVACRTTAAAPLEVQQPGQKGNGAVSGKGPGGGSRNKPSQSSGSGCWAHPRLALCRRNLGNALMFAAAAAANSSDRIALAEEAALQYGRAGDALDGCWGKQHRDAISLRQLEAWAKGFR